MSRLTEQDRGELLKATHFSHQTCEHIAPAVEQIVARHVAAALSEAADEIDGWRDNAIRNGETTDDPGGKVRAQVRVISYSKAARIVRRHAT